MRRANPERASDSERARGERTSQQESERTSKKGRNGAETNDRVSRAPMEESFNTFLSERIPPDSKRSTSGVIQAAFGERIIRVLKDPSAGDKNLCSYTKKHGFQLLDLPSLGVQNVLVVPVKGDAEVGQ